MSCRCHSQDCCPLAGSIQSATQSIGLLGKTVDVPLRSASGLAKGSYKASVELDQGGQATKVSRSGKINAW